MYVIRVDSCLKEGVGHVNLRKIFACAASSQDIIDDGERVAIMDGSGIDFTEIIHPPGFNGVIRSTVPVFWNTE